MHDAASKELWLRVGVYEDDFTRLGYPLTGLSKHLSDQFMWRNVKCNDDVSKRRLIEAETTTNYTL